MKPTHEVDAGAFHSTKSPTSGIQEAIDSLDGRGGRVRIPSGKWKLTRSVQVPSGVSLVGDGPSTILFISPLKVGALAKDIRKGGRVITLKGNVPFRVGQEIGVSDEVRGGWWGTHGLVEKIDGPQVTLSARFNRTLYASDDAKAVSLFPAITALDQEDLEIADLTILGPRGYKGKWWDFTYSTTPSIWSCVGVYASQMSRCSIGRAMVLESKEGRMFRSANASHTDVGDTAFIQGADWQEVSGRTTSVKVMAALRSSFVRTSTILCAVTVCYRRMDSPGSEVLHEGVIITISSVTACVLTTRSGGSKQREGMSKSSRGIWS